ncbi:flagellar hook-associated protein FlgK [Thermithiobacillus plumbiphilus]|uniref:Flagellar hook-associated protein 1 n=1 Tax=Thermithiobacillus plumbiphilus TaxID=1729899 RepID=A0ABU9DAN7_9PROT
MSTSSIGSLINSALGGLNIASSSLQTTGHNISNVNTPGYSRQSVLQSARTPQFSGAGFIGSGVQMEGVMRSYDSYLQGQLWDVNGKLGAASTMNAQLSQLNNMLSDPGSGLSPALNDFFAAVQAASNNPAGIPERQALISNAEVLANRFNALDGRMQDMANGVNTQLQDHVSTINTLAAELADLNRRILDMQGGNPAQQPNDLLDQRDQLIADLGKEVGVTVVPQDNGQVNVFIGTGQTLVAGAKYSALTTVQDPLDPLRLEVAYEKSGSVISKQLTSGTVGGLLRFRNESLDPARNALGRIAVGVASSMNDQQALGLDLEGQLGGNGANIFTMPKVGVQGAAGNTGSISSAVVSDIGKLQASDYRVTYDGSAWQVLRQSDGKTPSDLSVSGGTISFDGLTLTVGAAPATGDSFLVQPTRKAGSGIAVAIDDPRRLALAAPYVSNAGVNAGNVSVSEGKVSDAGTGINLPATAFGKPVDIKFDDPPSSFTITYSGGTVSSAYTEGMSINVPYPAPSSSNWSVSLSGTTPVAGDSFSLTPAGPGDNRNGLAMAALKSQNLLEGDSATFASSYGRMVTRVGTDGRQAQIAEKAQNNLFTQVQQAQQSVSGVNLDEEAANMMRYQQAYQASAKVIQIADSLFDSILAIKG